MIMNTNQEVEDLCKQAIELLNKKKQAQFELKECKLYQYTNGNNYTGRFFIHIEYFNHNGPLKYAAILDIDDYIWKENTIDIDKAAGLEKIHDIKLKIILRFAYLLYINYLGQISWEQEFGGN